MKLCLSLIGLRIRNYSQDITLYECTHDHIDPFNFSLKTGKTTIYNICIVVMLGNDVINISQHRVNLCNLHRILCILELKFLSFDSNFIKSIDNEDH